MYCTYMACTRLRVYFNNSLFPSLDTCIFNVNNKVTTLRFFFYYSLRPKFKFCIVCIVQDHFVLFFFSIFINLREL